MTSPAVRARTIVTTATALQVGVLDRTETLLRHALATDGALFFLAPAGSPLNAAALLPESPVVTATALDVAPVPTADRVRGSVMFSGRPRPVRRRLPAALVSFLCGVEAAPGRPVLELKPTSIQLHWRVERAPGTGSTPVGLEEYAAARPDPLCGWEAGFLRHLDEQHGALLSPLVRAAGTWLPEGSRLRPVLVDAAGLVLRVTTPDSAAHDVRLPFDRPAGCGCEAVEGFNALLDRAGLGATLE